MELPNSNTAKNSSARAYILAAMLLILVLLVFVAYFRAADCQQYLYLAQYRQQEYGIAPDSCLQNYLRNALIPSVVIALPFVFLLATFFLKERRKEFRFTKSKQEGIAFWLSVVTIELILLFLVLIKSIRCEGFGCLALGSLVAAAIAIFPPLIFGFSLWFLRSRYQWENQRFLAMTAGVIFLLLLAYFQTALF